MTAESSQVHKNLEERAATSVSKLRVHSFAISIDGYGAGPSQDLQHPLGVNGADVMEWLFHTRVWRRMHGAADGETGVDNEIAGHGTLASMSAKGDCYDNAVAESVFSTLEFELLMQHDWHTRDEARRGIFRYLETWYNPRRRHSTLGYLSPADYEQQLQAAA